MSAASTPVPRSLTSPGRSGPRHTLFLPVLIFLIGAGALALYQVMAMEDELDQMTQALDKMDGRIKHAQHEKAVFYKIASDVLRLAPTDPNAAKVAVYFKLRQLAIAQPELMNQAPPVDPIAGPTSTSPSMGLTNVGGVAPLVLTNVPSSVAPGAATK